MPRARTLLLCVGVLSIAPASRSLAPRPLLAAPASAAASGGARRACAGHPGVWSLRDPRRRAAPSLAPRRCVDARGAGTGAGDVGGTFVLRRGRPGDLPALTELSVQAFEPDFVEGVVDALQSVFGFSNHRSSVEEGLRKRLAQLSPAGAAGEGPRSDRADRIVGVTGAGGGGVSGGGRAVGVPGGRAEQGQAVAGEVGREGRGGVYELLVAEDTRDGSIAGMVELGILPCPIPVDRRPAPERPYLVNLAVHPDHRRQGLGQRLVSACETVAWQEWGYSELFLYVKKQNTAALCLYYSMGYVCEWQEPMWYKLKGGGQRMQRNPKMFLRKDQLGP